MMSNQFSITSTIASAGQRLLVTSQQYRGENSAMLYQNDAEMLFPARVIPSLRDLRGHDWKLFVDQVCTQAEDAPDVLAFSLMMIRLTSCLTCNSDSYRALRGCTQCAAHTVAKFKGSDRDLIEQWKSARTDVLTYLTSGQAPADM
jgi:hypothetical protein